MPTDEAIAYAQRGRGGRKRSTSGWESLTPAELNVVGLVSEGLSNKDIAERLFLSPRTMRRNVLIGDLVQTTDDKWITRPPSRCTKTSSRLLMLYL